MKLNRRQSFKLGLGGIAAGIAILANRETARTAPVVKPEPQTMEEKPALQVGNGDPAPAPFIVADPMPGLQAYPLSSPYIVLSSSTATAIVPFLTTSSSSNVHSINAHVGDFYGLRVYESTNAQVISVFSEII